VPLRVAGVFGAPVGKHAQQLDSLAVEERKHAIIEEVGCGDRRLAVIEFGERDLCGGVDDGLMVDTSNPLWFQAPRCPRVGYTSLRRLEYSGRATCGSGPCGLSRMSNRRGPCGGPKPTGFPGLGTPPSGAQNIPVERHAGRGHAVSSNP
jgi:hypothetical protein